MKRILSFIFLLSTSFMLSACNDVDQELTDFTLELIGEETVWIEEGTEYIEQGVLLNGEETREVSFQSNVDTSRVGTYYVQFDYNGVSLTRTVIVEAGALTEFRELLAVFNNVTNYSYTARLDVKYTKNGEETHLYDLEAYDINGDYSFGMWETNRFSTLYTQNNYKYINQFFHYYILL